MQEARQIQTSVVMSVDKHHGILMIRGRKIYGLFFVHAKM